MPPSELLAAMKRLRSWNVSLSARRFSANTGPTFLFTMTSQPSTQFQDQLTLFAVDSLAKTSAQPASRRGSRKVPAPVCSTNSCESFAWWDRNTSSWRTSQRSLLTEWTLFSERWPKQGLMRSGHVFRRVLWEPVTKGIGGGALPTPTAGDSKNRGYFYQRKNGVVTGWNPSLCGAVGAAKVPTTLPTPTTRDYKDSGPNVNYQKAAEKSRLPGAVVVQCSAQNGGGTYLNPFFVEEMMGYPTGWTALKP